jgi:hypothetical protein
MNQIDAMRALAWHGERVHVIHVTHGTDLSDDGYWEQDDVATHFSRCQPKVVLNNLAHCIRAGHHMFATDEQKLAELLESAEPKPHPGTPRKVKVTILRDKMAPQVLAVSVNGTRITSQKASGCWDVLETWNVDADLVVTACATDKS